MKISETGRITIESGLLNVKDPTKPILGTNCLVCLGHQESLIVIFLLMLLTINRANRQV